MENPFTTIENQLASIHSKLDKVLQEREQKNGELLTLGEYADALKRTKQTIIRWESEGKVAPVIVGGKKFYRNPNK